MVLLRALRHSQQVCARSQHCGFAFQQAGHAEEGCALVRGGHTLGYIRQYPAGTFHTVHSLQHEASGRDFGRQLIGPMKIGSREVIHPVG